jgi:hypothetical protein
MSVRTLATLAVNRDLAEPNGPVDKVSTIKPADGQPDHTKDGTLQGFTDTLISVIPTEPLSAYTALVAAFIAALKSDQKQYLPLRWWVYAAFLVLTALAVIRAYVTKKRSVTGGQATAGLLAQSGPGGRRFPEIELISALVAAAAWGLVTPGSPLTAQLSDDSQLFVIPTITIGTVAALSLLVSPLTQGSREQPSKSPALQASSNGAVRSEAVTKAKPSRR